MINSQLFQFTSKQLLLLQIIFLIILISLNVFLASYLRSSLVDVIWISDDGINLTITETFRKEGLFFFDTTSSKYSIFSVDNLLERYPSSTYPLVTKGPLYYIFLGTFLDFTNPVHDDLWLFGSFFNTILTSVFLVLLFLLIKIRFSITIAIFSTFLVVFSLILNGVLLDFFYTH